jgi:protein-glutamine gamma-glutamyltransferase
MSALAGDRSQRVELACFAALATFAAVQWATLVAHPPAGRVIVAVLLATGAGAGLAAISRLQPRSLRWGLAAVATITVVCAGMVVVGLPVRLLFPGNWGELGDNISRSLNGVGDVPIPYSGADPWTRLVILLAAPLLAGLAAFVAFWPRHRRVAGRVTALVLLLGLYFVAVAWAASSRQLAGGALLLVLVCAWLWLPGIAPARRTAAAIAVGAVAVIALPAATALDTGRGLVDYRHWGLFSANGQSFAWDQTYGPLDWPQKGTQLLQVSSEHTHYWKATNLNTFDGTRWVRSSVAGGQPALGEPLKFHPKAVPPRPDPEYVDRINIVDRGLNSDFAIGAGTILSLRGASARPTTDAVWEMNRQLNPGNEYTALIYDPQPSATVMRSAGTRYPDTARSYTTFSLGSGGSDTVVAPLWGTSGPPSLAERVKGTPYAGMYALASRLGAGARDPFEAVHRIDLYLRGHLEYRQNVPSHSYPLAAFLSQDRAGYCQQFSGTMALMLRMLGVPSRVATGFAPGGRDPERNNFLVDDTDAHDWVEVFFPGIGWVTFDPTPPAAPAATQLDDNALGVTKPEPVSNGGDAPAVPQQRGADAQRIRPSSSGSPHAGGGDSGPPMAALLGGAAGALALAGLGVYSLRRWRRGRMDPADLARAELSELDRALERIGSPLPAGTTLLGAEARLGELAGPAAAGYAARLRDGRYRNPDAAPPGVEERRAVRRALLSSSGARSLLRVLLAVPPGGPSPRMGRADSRTTRWARRRRLPSASSNAEPGSG